MHKILERQRLSEQVCRLTVEAADVAQAAQAGQFVMVRIDDRGERIPLTICDQNPHQGTIELIVQEAGATTRRLCALQPGDSIRDIIGPLGNPSPIKRYGTVLGGGGGVGIAELYPVLKACHEAGNTVVTVIAARTAAALILQDELRKISRTLYIATDDGSLGRKGLITEVVSDLLGQQKFDICFAVGPVVMMQRVAALTKPYGLKTLASLNTIMVDGTGMCGSCRVSVGNEVKFACVDGPDFDAHQVDFEELLMRQKRFAVEEQVACERQKEGYPPCPRHV